MLSTLDGKRITKVAHADRFDSIVRQLDHSRTEEVRSELHRILDDMPSDPKTGLRTFSSSHLGSGLSPWKHPLSHLYDVACEIAGGGADDDYIEGQAALIFGQFVWECVMARDESWVFYDPNLRPNDPNREITGKVYFERE